MYHLKIKRCGVLQTIKRIKKNNSLLYDECMNIDCFFEKNMLKK